MTHSSAREEIARTKARKETVTWLHERAKSMNDPHARAVLNSAAYALGLALPPSPPVEGVRDALVWTRFSDRKPRKGERDELIGEEHLLTWSVRVGTYDHACLDSEWRYGEEIDGHPDDLWAWLPTNPENALTQPAPTEKGEEDAEALKRYRAVTHWIGADSWDGCSDCMDRLRWAVSHDLGREMTSDEIAHSMRPYFADRAALAVSPPPAGDFSSCTSAATSRESK